MIVFTKAQRPSQWSAVDPLQAVADAAVPAWQAMIRDAFTAAREAVDWQAMREAIDANDLNRLEDQVQRAWWFGGRATLLQRVPDLVGALVIPAARVTFAEVSRLLRQRVRKEVFEITGDIALTFGLEDPRVQHWLMTYAGTLIQGIDQATLQGIREVLAGMLRPGTPTRTIVEQIRELIGLRPDQWQTVLRYHDALQEAEFTPRRIATLVEQRIQELKSARALLIARTESLNSANAVQLLSWQQAANEGLLERARTRRQWLPANDACATICAPIPGMNPHGVGLDEPFQTPIGPILAPSAHPH